MEKEINLSVIIPHYNSPRGLEKLLLSIPDREDIQVIVVDDNSTKELETLEEVRQKYADRAEFYRNETGIQSAGACRNKGIDLAAGRWILFADADDYFLPGLYQKVCPYFDAEYDMVIFTPVSADIETGEPAGRHRKHEIRIRTYLEDPSRKNYLSLCRTTTIWSKLIRKSVMREHAIYCSTSLHGNDFVCSQKLFYYCTRKKVTEESIYCVTQGRDSLTTRTSRTSFRNSVMERTKGCRFNQAHYSREDLRYIDLSGGEALVNGIKKHIGPADLLWGTGYFLSNGVNILPYRLRSISGIRDFVRRRRLI